MESELEDSPLSSPPTASNFSDSDSTTKLPTKMAPKLQSKPKRNSSSAKRGILSRDVVVESETEVEEEHEEEEVEEDNDPVEPEPSVSTPSVAKITTVLAKIVERIFKSGNHTDLTVKRVRAKAESELGLDDGFMRGDDIWATKSKEIIGKEVERLEKEADEAEARAQESDISELESEPELQVVKPKAKPAPKATRARKPAADTAATATKGRKRKAPADAESITPKPRKKKNTNSDVLVASSDDGKEVDKSEETSKSLEDTNHDIAEESEKEAQPQKSVNTNGDDSGEPPFKDAHAERGSSAESLSDLTTESTPPSDSDTKPTPKSPARRKSLTSKGSSSSLTSKSKSDSNINAKRATKAKAKTTSHSEALKTLQSWLLKCGVRKPWARVLAPFESQKDKVDHLKQTLEEIGMVGRPSLAKAQAIRQKRLDEQELRDIMEGNSLVIDDPIAKDKVGGDSRRRLRKRVGLDDDPSANKEDSDGEGEQDVPATGEKPIARGLRGMAFLIDSDGDDD